MIAEQEFFARTAEQELASKIADQFIGVSPEAWGWWCDYVLHHGLRPALAFAYKGSKDSTFPPGVRQSLRSIYSTLRKFSRELEAMLPVSLGLTLGYVMAELVSRRNIPWE